MYHLSRTALFPLFTSGLRAVFRHESIYDSVPKSIPPQSSSEEGQLALATTFLIWLRYLGLYSIVGCATVVVILGNKRSHFVKNRKLCKMKCHRVC